MVHEPGRRGRPQLTEREKEQSAKHARRRMRETRQAKREYEAERAEHAYHANYGYKAFNDVPIVQQPHHESVPCELLLARIKRIVGRTEPLQIDFEFFPGQPFTMPVRDAFLPGKWTYRTGVTAPHARYIVRHLTKDEMMRCDWDLFELRCEPGVVWRRPEHMRWRS